MKRLEEAEGPVGGAPPARRVEEPAMDRPGAEGSLSWSGVGAETEAGAKAEGAGGEGRVSREGSGLTSSTDEGGASSCPEATRKSQSVKVESVG